MEHEDFDGPRTTVGSVYRDLLDWSTSLPRWQQELLRRLLHQETLSSDDLDELSAAAVAETEQQASQYAALSVSDLPSIAAREEPNALVAIQNLRNVNVLRDDQSLTFGPQLTVVYGDNASGKSGYGRVLKKVCRARVIDDILGDVRAEVAPAGVATATFVTKTPTGQERVLEWVDGSPVSNFARFAVLDAACARTYLRGGSLHAGPAGIDLPGRFAQELDRMKHRLTTAAAATKPNKQALRHLETDTDVGRLIKSLSSSTSDDTLNAAAGWTTDDEQDLERLETALTAAKAHAPSARRAGLQTRIGSLRSLCDRITTWAQVVSVTAVEDLRATIAAIDEASAALSAVESLSDAGIPENLLVGTVWTDLLAAARRYVESLSGVGGPDSLSIDGRCVLCWQTLDQDAKNRLRHFQELLEGAAQKARQKALRRRDGMVSALQQVPRSTSTDDVALLVSMEAQVDELRELIEVLSAHRDRVLASVESGEWSTLPEVENGALIHARKLLAGTEAELRAIPSSDEDAGQQVAELTQQRLELATRKALATSLDQVRQFVRNTLEYQRLKAAENAINTRAASNKAAELHAKHMTDRYAGLVDGELRELRFRRRKPVLVQKTNKAKVEVTPLVSSKLKHLSPEKVFSEGERTAIALACFLAELHLGNDPSGMIFDDPVSSFDHHVREHVARRLVRAAKDRQVIVFTHDLAFLADLREQARKIQTVNCQFRTLVATDFHAGFVEAEEPFGARGVKKRVGALKELLVKIETHAKNGALDLYRDRSREFYDQLRSTWERFIEERMFAGVVQRLERNVTPGALPKVAYSKELAESVYEGWRRCSNVIEAHDHAPAAGTQSSSVEEMREDLQRLIEAEQAKASP